MYRPRGVDARHGTGQTAQRTVPHNPAYPDPVYEGVAEHITAHASDPHGHLGHLRHGNGQLPDSRSTDTRRSRTAHAAAALARVGGPPSLSFCRQRPLSVIPQQRVKDALGAGTSRPWLTARAGNALNGHSGTDGAVGGRMSHRLPSPFQDRPILLERAARSVAGQTYRNIRWVVVMVRSGRHALFWKSLSLIQAGLPFGLIL